MKIFYHIFLTGLLITSCKNAQVISSQAIDTDKTLYTIAFGSCNRQDSRQPLWQPILQHHPDLWIWLGDNIYADTHDMQAMEAMYLYQKSLPEYQALYGTTPVIGIWDDHDYGMNDGGKYYSKKDESRDLMLDFLDVPQDASVRNRKGGYSSYMFGKPGQQVKVILLDTRYFRDTLETATDGIKLYKPSEEGDILGEDQWQWLEEELANSTAQIHVIGSSIQVISAEHGYEKWANFPTARQRLFDLVASTQAKGVFFLSGDRHIGEISKYNHPGIDYPLYDITSSGLTHTWREAREEENPYRLGELVIALNFGVIEIDWEQQPVEVTFSIMGENNKAYSTLSTTY